MDELFGEYPTTELNYETPFQCLIAVMMSAQTTDKQVNVVTNTLFQKIKGPQDVVDMWLNNFSKAINTVWLWRGKAKNIYATAWMLLEKSKQYEDFQKSEHAATELWNEDERVYTDAKDVFVNNGYVIPDLIDEMMTLPWVGEKTAKVVLYVLYKQRRVAVDTHVHRVMNRLWVVNTKTPEQTSTLLETRIPDSYKDIAHHTIIYFWRYLCMARKPQCDRCPLTRMCTVYHEFKKKQ